MRTWNICIPKKYGPNNEKTFWWQVGKVFENEKGQLSINLNSKTLMQDKYHAFLIEREPVGETQPRSATNVDDEEFDDIPF